MLLLQLLGLLLDIVLVALAVSNLNLLGTHNLVLRPQELDPVSQPPRASGHSEEHCHELGVEP